MTQARDDSARRTPRSLCVVGGGTAGYFAALAVKRRFPEMRVTVVDSSEVPIIGVGEATTTLMPPFLHGQLGLDIVDLFRTVRPTFKLGIRFLWGPPGLEFAYPFGDADPIEAFVHDGDLRTQSLMAMLMAEDRTPVLRGPNGELLSLLPRMKFAYHLDNAPFVGFLVSEARRAGILHVDATISRAERGERGDIVALISNDGRRIEADFFVDASGFRSLLVEETLGSPFTSYASSLFCDRAIVATVPQRGPIQPYTTAETMDAGWCWRIPVEGEDHRGYVHASSFLDEDRAVEEMRSSNPGMGEPWIVRFRSGRHRDFWIGNTAAVGNAYGFVEPLESTALHMVIVEIAYLLGGLEAMAAPGDDGQFPLFASEAVGAHWDYLRWFLSIHYRFNGRRDTPFWRAARDEVDISGLGAEVDRFVSEGPLVADGAARFAVGDPAFGYSGLTMLLLGQGIAPRGPMKTAVDATAWRERTEKQRRVARRGLEQREALQALRENPEMLRALATSPTSWCRGEAERVSVPPTARAVVHRASGLPPVRSDEALVRSLRR